MHKDPIKRGRGHSFLSDSQIHQIRQRRQMGQTYLQIAKAFGMHETAIGKICRGETYSTPCNDDTISGYKFDFGNRLTRTA